MITDIIKQAREMLENCSDGPWAVTCDISASGDPNDPPHRTGPDYICDPKNAFICEPQRIVDSDLIVFARNNMAAILDEVERLRDALKFYADETPGIRVEKAVPNGASCFMVIDRGQIARKALEGEG